MGVQKAFGINGYHQHQSVMEGGTGADRARIWSQIDDTGARAYIAFERRGKPPS